MVSDEILNVLKVVGIFIVVICMFVAFVGGMNWFAASRVDTDNMKNDQQALKFPWEFIKIGPKTFADNESYLKFTFDANMNADQGSFNRGIDFSKCYAKNNSELTEAVNNDTHYAVIRGETPDAALKTLEFPAVMLKAGFAIPDPSKLYVSRFSQISPNEYKIWIITKTPAVETIDGALERTCQVRYWY